MSGINPESIKSANYTVAQFKAMVNEKNPTNRGYVRVSADGSSLEKVSKHWYSLPFHGLRSRVSAEYNTAMREAFVKALRNDMRYLEPDFAQRKSLADRVLNNHEGGDSVQNTESLSRKEIAAILEAHTERINSVLGRKAILENLFNMVANEHGCADVELFKSYMKVNDGPLKSKLDNAVKDKKVGDKWEMEMSEMDFRDLISSLEEAAATAGCRIKADAGLKELTQAHLELNSDVGFFYDLENSKALADLRGALERTLKNQIAAIPCPEKETTGGGVKYLNLFLKHVLPTMIRRATADINAMGLTQKDNPEEFIALFEQHCSYDKIEEFAKNFLVQARKGLMNRDAWREQLSKSFGDQSKVSAFFGNACRAGFGKAIKGSVAWSTLKEGTRKAYAELIVDEYMKALPLFEKDVVDDLFVKSFLVQQFGDDPTQKVGESHTVTEKMKAHREEVIQALKINLGERTEQDGKKADSCGGLVAWADEAAVRGYELLDQKFPNISDKRIQQVLQFTLSNIVNTRIKNQQDGVSSTLKLADYQPALDAMEATGKCLTEFDEKVEAEKAKMRKAMNNLITATMKKGHWDVSLEERKLLLDEFDREFDDMCEMSVRDFLDEEVYGGDEFKAATEKLSSKFEAGKEELRGTLLKRLQLLVFSHVLGPQQKAALKNGSAEALASVEAFNDERQKAGKTCLNKTQLNALAVGELQRLWDKTVLDVLAKQPKETHLSEKVVDQVREKFNKEVPSVLKRSIDFVQRFEGELQQMVGVTVDTAFSKDGLFEAYADPSVGKDELKQLKGWMKDSILASLNDQKNQIELEQLRNPMKKVKNGQLDNLVDHLLGCNGRGNILHAMVRLGTKRSETVIGFAQKFEYADQISKALAADLKTKNEALPNEDERLMFSERTNLLERVTGDIFRKECEGTLMFARAQKLPMLYPSELNGEHGFIAQVTKETGDKLDALVAGYRNFRAEFIKQATSAHGPETDYAALGSEKLAKARDYFLDRLSKMDPLPKQEVAQGLYRTLLKNLTGDIIEDTQMAFDAFAAQYERVYDQVMPGIRAAFDHDTVQKMLVDAGAPESAIKLVFDTLLPRYMSNIAEDIGSDIDRFDREGRPETEKVFAEKYVQKLVDRIKSMRIDTDDGLCNLIRNCGYAAELDDAPTKEMMLKNLRIWAKDETVKQQRADMVCASLLEEMNEYQQGEFYQKNEALQADIAAFDKTAKGVIGDMFRFAIVNKFDKGNVNSAKLQIKRFVEEGWQIKDDSVKQRIMEIFYQRIKDLLEKDTLSDDDVILDFSLGTEDGEKGTLDYVNDEVNTHGRDLYVFKGLENQLINEYYERITDEAHTAFGINRTVETLNNEMKVDTAMAVTQFKNAQNLLAYVRDTVHQCAEDFVAANDKYHNVVQNAGDFFKIVENAILKGYRSLLQTAEDRVNCASVLPESRLRAESAMWKKVLVPSLANGSKFLTNCAKGTQVVVEDISVTSKTQDLWNLAEDVVLLLPDPLPTQLRLFVDFVKEEYGKRMDQVSYDITENVIADRHEINARLLTANVKFIQDLRAIKCPPELEQAGFGSSGLLFKTGWVDTFLDTMAKALKKIPNANIEG